MTRQRPDVIDLLKKEREYHLEQVQRINNALAAFEGELTKTNLGSSKSVSKAHKIQWTAPAREVFDTGVEITTEQLREKLAEKGIVEALDDSYKNSIYATVSRLAKSGYIEKTENGTYRKSSKAGQLLFKINGET